MQRRKRRKERVFTPVLEAAPGCLVVRVTGYDTERLGTFTRDIPRAGTQLEARKKARFGMKEMDGLTMAALALISHLLYDEGRKSG